MFLDENIVFKFIQISVTFRSRFVTVGTKISICNLLDTPNPHSHAHSPNKGVKDRIQSVTTARYLSIFKDLWRHFRPCEPIISLVFLPQCEKKMLMRQAVEMDA